MVYTLDFLGGLHKINSPKTAKIKQPNDLYLPIINEKTWSGIPPFFLLCWSDPWVLWSVAPRATKHTRPRHCCLLWCQAMTHPLNVVLGRYWCRPQASWVVNAWDLLCRSIRTISNLPLFAPEPGICPMLTQNSAQTTSWVDETWTSGNKGVDTYSWSEKALEVLKK